MDKRIVLTGASGHIGSHVAEVLLQKGFSPVLITRKKNQNILRLEAKGAGVVIANLSDPSEYAEHLRNTDVLFHIASENTTDTSDPQRIVNNTFGLSKTVLDAALNAGIKTIVYTSSVVVLGRSKDASVLITENDRVQFPESPYVKGKLLAEEYCDLLIKEKKADIRRIYPSWVIGPGDAGLTPPHKIIKNYLEKGQSFSFKGGISIASAEDVALAHVNAWLLGKRDEKYITSGDNLTFPEFYSLLAEFSGKKAPLFPVPKWILWCASLAAKILLGKRSPASPSYIRAVVGNYSWYDSSKAKKELGYSSASAQEILKKAVLEAKQRALGIRDLKPGNNGIAKTAFPDSDILLITGFPGWLGNRMLDIFMNGDRYGDLAVDRKIRLLVQPAFKGLIDLPSKFEIVYGDITDRKSLDAALKNVSTVFHLAGVIYPKKISSYYKVNELGTKNLVDSCIAQGIRRILFMSTDSVCGFSRGKKFFSSNEPPRPYKNYGRSKYLAEKYILDKTAEGLIDGSSLRGFWFFGPFMPERNMSFFRMFHWKRQIVFGNGKNNRSISHVDNIVQAFSKAEKRKETIGKWYWIGNKTENYSVDRIYREVAEGLGRPYSPFYIPPFICELFSIFDTIISWTGRINATIHAAGKFHKNIAGDVTEAEKDFGYDPKVGFTEIKKELKDLVKI
jgi:dihydroflavonol-4-reductase